MNHVSNLGTRLRNCNGSRTNLLLVRHPESWRDLSTYNVRSMRKHCAVCIKENLITEVPTFGSSESHIRVSCNELLRFSWDLQISTFPQWKMWIYMNVTKYESENYIYVHWRNIQNTSDFKQFWIFFIFRRECNFIYKNDKKKYCMHVKRLFCNDDR